MNAESKNIERKCLDIVKHMKRYAVLQGNIVESERPDFIIGSTGLEHFLVDVITNHGSIDRKQAASIENKVRHYNEHPDLLSKDIASNDAANYVQNIANEQIRGISNFDYQVFISNFKRIFDKHYNNISVYRSKCDRLGFLIEIPYVTPVGQHGYIITNNGKRRYQALKTIPITTGMINCFKYKPNVDFIIICALPVNFKNDYSECQVVMIDMNNIEASIRQQKMIICDEFDFSLKFKSDNVVHLTTIHNDTKGD